MSRKIKMILAKLVVVPMVVSIFSLVGKPSINALAASNEVAFTDDFEDGNASGWTIQKGQWSVKKDGANTVYSKSGKTEARVRRGDTSWKDYSVEGKINVDNFNGNNRAELCGRYTDGNNYYAISLSNDDGGTVEIRKKVKGKSTILESASLPISVNKWYNVKLDMNGSTIKAYVDGELKLTATDTSLISGAVGLVPFKVSAKYDDIEVSTGEVAPPVSYKTPTLTPNTKVDNATSVTISIENFGEAPIKQYKIDNGAWQDYTTPVVVDKNCTIYAQGSDNKGNKSTVGSLVVSNIGSVVAPVSYSTPILTLNTTADNVSSVIINIGNFGEAPIKQYKIDNGAWQDYTTPVVVDKNCTIYAQGSDNKENKSTVGSLIVSNISSVVQPVDSNAIYVSPSGEDSAEGTVNNPTTFVSALTKVAAGGTIYMIPGTYSYSNQITIDKGNDGTSDKIKRIMKYGTGNVVLDFSSEPYVDPSKGSNPRGLQINGNYWHIKGINVTGSADNGIYIGGSNDKIELCETYSNRDSGLQLGRYAPTALDSEWPANNLILNCTSYDNSDPDNGEDADGFACKLTTSTGNVFDGCISHNNVDDGWDLFTKPVTGPIGPVTIKNCVSYNNGVTSSGSSTANSDGNGFKLGGAKIAVNHVVSNCVSFNNKKHGFTYNSNPGSISLTNCTGYNNGISSGSNFAFDSGTHVFTNLLSYKATSSDKISGSNVQNSNVWWIEKKTTNAKGLACNDADFVSLTPSISRNDDGSVNLGNFLKLAEGSDLIGAGTPSGTDIGVKRDGSITPTVTPTEPVTYSTPTLAQDTTATNVSSVTVSIGNFGTAQVKQYKIDNGAWQDYTKPIVVDKNCTIYAQGSDSKGNKSSIGSLVVNNIGSVTPPVDTNAIYVGGTDGKTLAQAISVVKSGNTIIVRGTVNSGAVTIPSGVTIKGETGAKINFSGASKGISIPGTGVIVRDLEIYGSGDNGIYITGSNNKIINCIVHDNKDSGVQLCNGAANNLIQQVYSHHNADASGGNADGFACKLHSGEGNVFDHCTAESNSDDGYDLYAAHGAVTFISCVAKNNGECYGKKGNGSGFKVGGADNKTPGEPAHLDPLNHTLTDCISEGNKVGFDRNNQNGIVTMTRCTAISNTAYNFRFLLKSTPSAIGHEVIFGIANIDNCTSINSTNDITGAILIGNCTGF